jgi:hypothetical protein
MMDLKKQSQRFGAITPASAFGLKKQSQTTRARGSLPAVDRT